MSAEEALRALAQDAAEGLEPVLRKAYELGYREGLAQAPRMEAPPVAPAAPATGDPPGPEADPAELELELEPEDPGDAPPAPPPVDWGSTDAPPSEHPHAQSDGPRPIFPHASVGTLLARIYEHFVLDRFDIDVVICRKGDRSRRQLKKSVKLGKYAVGG